MLETASFGAESSSPRSSAAHHHRYVDLQLLGQLLIALRKDDQLNLAYRILQRGLCVQFARPLRLRHLQPSNDAGNGDLVLRLFPTPPEVLRLGLHLARRRRINDLQIAQLLAVLVHRMPRDKEIQAPPSRSASAYARPTPPRSGRSSSRLLAAAPLSESKIPNSPCWPASLIALRLLRPLHRLVESRRQLRPSAEAVHRSRLDQRLDHALVHQPQIDLLAELPQAGKALLPCLLQRRARGNDRLNRIVPDVLDRSQPKADRVANRRKVRVRNLHIRAAPPRYSSRGTRRCTSPHSPASTFRSSAAQP